MSIQRSPPPHLTWCAGRPSDVFETDVSPARCRPVPLPTSLASRSISQPGPSSALRTVRRNTHEVLADRLVPLFDPDRLVIDGRHPAVRRGRLDRGLEGSVASADAKAVQIGPRPTDRRRCGPWSSRCHARSGRPAAAGQPLVAREDERRDVGGRLQLNLSTGSCWMRRHAPPPSRLRLPAQPEGQRR